MCRMASLFKEYKNMYYTFFSITFAALFLHQTSPFLKIILEQSKRPRLEVGHQGVVFQHPGASVGVPLQQLMPTAQGKTLHQNELFQLRTSQCMRVLTTSVRLKWCVAKVVDLKWFLKLGCFSESQ